MAGQCYQYTVDITPKTYTDADYSDQGRHEVGTYDMAMLLQRASPSTGVITGVVVVVVGRETVGIGILVLLS